MRVPTGTLIGSVSSSEILNVRWNRPKIFQQLKKEKAIAIEAECFRLILGAKSLKKTSCKGMHCVMILFMYLFLFKLRDCNTLLPPTLWVMGQSPIT